MLRRVPSRVQRAARDPVSVCTCVGVNRVAGEHPNYHLDKLAGFFLFFLPVFFYRPYQAPPRCGRLHCQP